MKPALLIIDFQEAFSGGPNAPYFEASAAVVNDALAFFRQKGFPIVWIHQTNEAQGLVPGEKKFGVYSGLDRGTDGVEVHKRFSNSFRQTELDEVLKKAGADTLVVAGFRAQNCINETYCSALERGYYAVLLKGAIVTGDAEAIRIVERACDSVPLRTLKKLMHQGKTDTCGK
ncbi:MAG: isochorismatase family protein [Spirochaetales bacterium]|nr:isochorismatase family protein [Spirochaetales bacterium]